MWSDKLISGCERSRGLGEAKGSKKLNKNKKNIVVCRVRRLRDREIDIVVGVALLSLLNKPLYQPLSWVLVRSPALPRGERGREKEEKLCNIYE